MLIAHRFSLSRLTLDWARLLIVLLAASDAHAEH